MLALLMNLGFAGGGTVTPVEETVTKGGGPTAAVDWKRLHRLRMQQSYIRDDEEALALILAELTRR